jgi:hypothetical protein
MRSPATGPILHRIVPVSEALRDYGRVPLRRDLLAGLTVAALALPRDTSGLFGTGAGLRDCSGARGGMAAREPMRIERGSARR